MRKFCFAIFLFCLINCITAQKLLEEEIDEEPCPFLKAQNTLISILEDETYDHLSPPVLPVFVNFSVVIRDISEVNEPLRYAAFLLTLEQTWVDERLMSILPPSCSDKMRVPLNPNLNKKIWRPPTRLLNSIAATTVDTPVIPEQVSVTPRGKVSYIRNLEASFPCFTDYVKFPFDRIICDMVIATVESEEFLKLNFSNKNSVRYLKADGLRLATFAHNEIKLTGLKVRAGDFMMYNAEITLQRLTTFYILQVFIPNILVIIVAWFSFLFPIDHVRISLLLSTLITSTFQYGNVAGSLPKVGYLKGIDLFMVGGISLVFLAMLEYSLLVYIGWFSDDGKKRAKILGCFKLESKKLQNIIDRIARVLYLALFAAFIACYVVFFVLSTDKTSSVLSSST